MTISAHPRRHARHDRSCGIALLAVLWLVAALSIMVSGLLHAVRSETSIAGQYRDAVLHEALADASIRLVLQELIANKTRSVKSIQNKTIAIFGADIHIQVIPLNGQVDLNNASQELLADTFQYGGGMTKEKAQQMATIATDARDTKAPDGTPVRFHALADLLRLDGIDYNVYAKMRNLLTVDLVGTGRVNPLAASLGTLLILAKGDQARAQQLLESRLSTPESMDTTSLSAASIDMSPTSFVAIRATTMQRNSVSFERTWSVDIASPAYGLPWRLLGVDQGLAPDIGAVK